MRFELTRRSPGAVFLFLTVVSGLILWAGRPASGQDEFLPGGPLAGLVLPPFPTQHGEPPGYPGCLPDPNNPGKLLYDTDGLSAEVQLHPESVEHWRANDFKYLPTRSLFDRQSLLRNWKAPNSTPSLCTGTAAIATTSSSSRRTAPCPSCAASRRRRSWS
jgi:hypothetical protein